MLHVRTFCKAIYTGSEYVTTVAYEALSMHYRKHGCCYYSEQYGDAFVSAGMEDSTSAEVFNTKLVENLIKNLL
jgi:hypothetical protein